MLKTLRELGELIARFPAFRIRLIRSHHGTESFEAVRKSGPGDAGLYALISGDAAEMADELKRAA